MSRIATRMTATAVAAGAILAAAALPATAAAAHHGRHHPHRPAVVLGAIQNNSPGVDNFTARSLDAEWVTVTNTTRHSVNLSGWTLTAKDHHHTYRFRHLSLGGRRSVRVHTGIGRNTSRDVFQDSRTYVWSNTADTATLRDSRGSVVDTKSWGHHGRRGGR